MSHFIRITSIHEHIYFMPFFQIRKVCSENDKLCEVQWCKRPHPGIKYISTKSFCCCTGFYRHVCAQCFKVWMAPCSFVRQEVEFINVETKVLWAPPLRGRRPVTGVTAAGPSLSRQSAFVVAGFQPPCQPLNKGT